MTSNEALRNVLIGGDSLLIECGEILLAKGHAIAAVAASSPRVATWAHTHNLTVIDASGPAQTWEVELSQVDFDWLFAITYLEILPASVISLPKRGAINFHDGPLPAYAGLNAPAWALLNNEPSYGISWHLITEGLDEGDLLAQRSFEIASAETSLSLNTRNFGAAIEAFDDLVDQLASGSEVATPQDSSIPRTAYSRIDRPPAAQVIDWSQPAHAVDRLLRALTFGPYPNPLGIAKLWAPTDEIVLIEAGAIVDGEGEAGEILEVTDDRIVVACSDGAVALTKVATLDGVNLTIDAAISRLNLDAGTRLPLIDDVTADQLTATHRSLASSERHHLELLSSLEPLELPWARTAVPGESRHFEVKPIEWADGSNPQVGPTIASFATLLSRLTGKERVHLGLAGLHSRVEVPAPFEQLLAPAVPFEVAVAAHDQLAEVVDRVDRAVHDAQSRPQFARELVARHPDLANLADFTDGRLLPLAIRIDQPGDPLPGVVAELDFTDGQWSLRYDRTVLDPGDAELLVDCLRAVHSYTSTEPATTVAEVDILSPTLRHQVLHGWNDTARALDGPQCLHQLIEGQVDSTPDAVAVVFEDVSITYRDLDERANRLAHHLVDLGAGPDVLIGVHVGRGIDLVVAVLAVHKAGAAYVPLDPAYPADRLTHMISDSRCPVVLTTSSISGPLPHDQGIIVVDLDTDRATIDARPDTRPQVNVEPHNLAYCIYTSGSTGLPKGVLVEHRNVANFFVGMDERVPHSLPATWLAVTSLSFDISVLELIYTLSRGFSVVVYLDRDREATSLAAEPERLHDDVPIDFSLFYFSGDEAQGTGSEKYRLLLEGARFADANNFCAIWTPERHFHAFGGLYPQPAVTSAAVAAITNRVNIRAGSVVMPLTDPIRVAEAWSIVDNISDGRVGISVASGWQPNDFVLRPETYSNPKQAMFDGIETVKRLWRGEQVTFEGPLGPVEVSTLPRPVQPELPVWVTTAGNPETYIQAGEIGANVLTHLLGQSVEQLAPKIEAYRQARADAGFDPDAGVVTLMLHTFIGPDDHAVRELVREPLKQYLGTSFSLLREYAWSFPAFQRPAGSTDDHSLDDEDFKNLSEEDLDAVLEFAFERYYETSGLFGSPERAAALVDTLKGIGVGEIACLIDFGVDTDTVLDSLPQLDALRQLTNNPAPEATEAADRVDIDHSFAAEVRRHGVTHLQCTPSMARMFTLHEDSRGALSEIDHLFIGGEAFPLALANDLRTNSRSGQITNMYGPTETTIWSTTWALEGALDLIPIGTPIANTYIYVLDAFGQPLPPGVAGELWIGGDGVVRGYHDRAELTAERFVADPFREGNHRMYFTGDLARWSTRPDGSAVLEFLGRTDHQVKLRGYRIELGEIEAALGRYDGVRECVVVVHGDDSDEQQLVAYVSPRGAADIEPGAVRDALRNSLPEIMVPAHIAVLDDLPHTPNGKIDRNALPGLAQIIGRRSDAAPPTQASNDLERQVLGVWKEILGNPEVGVEDNFFDVGGHSLLIVRLHRRLKDEIARPISLTDLYRFPTVRGFAESLDSDKSAEVIQGGVDRAARRRESLQRRRARG